LIFWSIKTDIGL